MPRRERATATRGEARYSDPALRDRLKRRILAGSKGGAAGRWSARKAQLLAQEYERQGGRYRGAPTAKQRSLKRWTAQDWTTADGGKARRRGTTARYLPRTAWSRLSPAERKATDDKKRAGAARGRTKVANTARAKGAASAARGTKRKRGAARAGKKRAASTSSSRPS